jgi:SHS2 domain-containing protein
MPYEFLDHEADIGIRAWGKSLEEAFAEGATALFDIMVDVKKVENKESVDIQCEGTDIPALFVEWLNALLTQADITDLVFSDFKDIRILPLAYNLYKLHAKASGEKLDAAKHNIKVEAKAATYHGLKYETKDSVHYLQCVVDV